VGGILGGGQLAFAIGDVVSWARDTPFSSGWAVFEIVYSSVVALADLVFVVGLGLDGGPDVGAIVGVGLAPLALGARWDLESTSPMGSGVSPQERERGQPRCRSHSSPHAKACSRPRARGSDAAP
jgi:hypothetical protein